MLSHFDFPADPTARRRFGDISWVRGRHGHAVRQLGEQKPIARAPRKDYRHHLRLSTNADGAEEI